MDIRQEPNGPYVVQVKEAGKEASDETLFIDMTFPTPEAAYFLIWGHVFGLHENQEVDLTVKPAACDPNNPKDHLRFDVLRDNKPIRQYIIMDGRGPG